MKNFYERGSRDSRVYASFFHPEWNEDADLAILLINFSIQFNQKIQKVCLPKPVQKESISTGMIIGWNQHNNESTDWRLQMSLANKVKCQSKTGDTSSNISCLSINDQIEEPEDAGFFIQEKATKSWTFEGFVSDTLVDYSRIFTVRPTVAQHIDWITYIVSSKRKFSL